MPLTFGIPLGLLLTAAGAILFYTTDYKKMAKAVLVIGAGVTILTFILIVLVIFSPM
jgi:fucose permease